MLNRKFFTKLLNREFRQQLLADARNKITKYKTSPYAKYIVDSQTAQRADLWKDSRDHGWGYPEINLVCSVRQDGSVKHRLLEFKTVNHFLKDNDIKSALEVVECILLEWVKDEPKKISSFDVKTIDDYLVELDKQLAKKQKIQDSQKKEDKDNERSV